MQFVKMRIFLIGAITCAAVVLSAATQWTPAYAQDQRPNIVQGEFQTQGLAREMWATAEPIRRIFREAFTAVGFPAFNPHSFRKTLVRVGQRVCRTPEEWKAWSQNLGHESEATTFVGYGEVPAHRQAEIMEGLGKPSAMALPPGLDIQALKAFLKSAEQSAA